MKGQMYNDIADTFSCQIIGVPETITSSSTETSVLISLASKCLYIYKIWMKKM